ncbi:hypothetical protein [Nocardioides sp. BYT-33-1]|uniref:hypothetical protein n=1 Tax=Nocardioides sp. BYT-33-1 TaxID=3416952 RepID=UPI003F539E58
MRAPRTPSCLRLPSSRRLTLACTATTAALALAACAGGPSTGEEPSSSGGAPSRPTDEPSGADGSATTARRTAPAFTGTQHAIPTGAALDNVPDLYELVAQTGCEATADGWRAEGTAANPGTAEQGFTVLVFFTDPQARIVDSASATVTVAPGETGTWTAERAFAAPAGTSCVVRAVNSTDQDK